MRNLIFAKLISIIFGKIASESCKQNQRSAHWRKVLKKCKAKVVFAIQPEIALCRAGRELEVQIFDVQHGIISDSEDNPFYSTKNRLSMETKDLPHGYLCWDDSSAAVLRPLACQKGYSVHIIGNAWVARFAAPDANDLLVQYELALFKEKKTRLPTILVTLQPNMHENAPDYVSNGVMVACLEDVIRETCRTYFWYIRLHPSQILNEHSGSAKKKLHIAE